MSDEPRWLSERDVVELVDLAAAADAVTRALRLQAEGHAQTMDKTHVSWDGHTLHALGGEIAGAGVVGTKTWAHTAGGAEPLLVLWDADTGALRAVIEAFALGQLRTASVSVVATRLLADPAADTLAVIGTGKQALAQVAAGLHARPLTRIQVFSPTPAHRSSFATRVRAAFPGHEVEVADSVRAAVDGAAVVTTATRAREAFLDASMLAPNAHVNAIGAITPERRELAPDVAGTAALVTADSPSVAQRLSDELTAATRVLPLAEVAAGLVARPEAGHTLAKAMGIGLADVAVGLAVLERALDANRGHALPVRERHHPQLQVRDRGGDAT